MSPEPKTPQHTRTSGSRPISDEAVFKVAKEVIVKFIEVGRLSPDSFAERFSEVYRSIRQTVRKHDPE